MSIAKTAQGTLLKIGDGASPEGFTTVPGCQRLSGPDVKVELNDVTSHDSTGGFREFLPGLKDGDNVTAEMLWVPSNTVHKGIRVDAYAATLRNWQLVFPDTADDQVDYAGYVTGFPPVANVGEPMRNTLTVKVTGQPTWSTAA